MVHSLTKSDTTNDNKLQRMTTRDNKRVLPQIKTNKSKCKKVILGFKMKQKANLVPEGFCSIFNQCITNYDIFSNTEYL